MYVEYASIANSESVSGPRAMNLERVVVTDSTFCKELPYMSLLGINGSYVLPMKTENPILVVAKSCRIRQSGLWTGKYGKHTPVISL